MVPENAVRDDETWIEPARAAMVAEIAAEVVETRSWLGKEALAPRVMAAMAKVPRHEFVPLANWREAYDNRPLPIGQGQTISQPYIVAVMTDAAALAPGDKVLEIGTGCGYQAAVLAELAARVISIEAVPELAATAADRLRRLGYDRVEVHQGDGSLGWPAEAPYDAIVVTAAAKGRVPPALIEQLGPGGRLVIPVEKSGGGLLDLGWSREQQLMVLAKDAEGRVGERDLLPVAFVPLIESATGREKA